MPPPDPAPIPRGASIERYLVAAAAILAMLAIATPLFLKARVRWNLDRVKADLRTLAVAVETYVVEYNALPECSSLPGENPYAVASLAGGEIYGKLPSFKRNADGSYPMLSPKPCLPRFLNDPFGSLDLPYPYWTGGDFGIVWSAGPDGQYDLTMDNIPRIMGPKKMFLIDDFAKLIYDPSNGTYSKGDIYRIMAVRDINSFSMGIPPGGSR